MSNPSSTRFGLHWAGKDAARARAHTPTRATLRPDRAESVDWDQTGHVFVEGDNLEVLKVLRPGLQGRVRLVFIDPPYNTGQSFIYPDRYRDGVAEYLVRSGQADSSGRLLEANPETAGRHHARWLDLMLPRLELARDLLAANGALVVTIDDHEVHHLRVLLDEVFGRASFVACCAWQKSVAKKNKALISKSHDHVLIYARDIREWERNLWPRTEAQLKAYRNPDGDPRGRWQSVAYSVPSEDGHRRAAYRYAIETPSGGAVEPPPGRHWNGLPTRTADLVRDGRLWFGRTGDRRPRLKVFLSEVQGGIVPDTWWSHEVFGHNQEAKKELLALFDDAEPFSTPKPTRLIRRILQMATHADQEDIVLDFFAGSGTTGHAVWQQNAEDGGNRRFVLVQLPHPTGDSSWSTISALARERLRRAADAVEGPGDRGFRAFCLAVSGQRGVEIAAGPSDSNGAEAFVFEAGLAQGLSPSVDVAPVLLADHTLYQMAGERLIVCPSACLADPDALMEALIGRFCAGRHSEPPMVVFRHEAFATDAVRRATVRRLSDAGFSGVHFR